MSQSDSERAFARADLRWLISIAERERSKLLDEQGNTSREEGRRLGQAITRVKAVFLS